MCEIYYKNWKATFVTVFNKTMQIACVLYFYCNERIQIQFWQTQIILQILQKDNPQHWSKYGQLVEDADHIKKMILIFCKFFINDIPTSLHDRHPMSNQNSCQLEKKKKSSGISASFSLIKTTGTEKKVSEVP